MNRRKLLKNLAASIPALYLSKELNTADYLPNIALNEPIAKGPFNPTWQSLQQYKTPKLVSGCEIWNLGALRGTMSCRVWRLVCSLYV